MTDCVDFTRIQETSDGDSEFEIELIEMYLEDAKEHLDNIAGQVESGALEALKRTAHTLKGSSANIGAIQMQQVSLQIEGAVDEKNMDLISSLKPSLQQAYQETEKIYRDYMVTLQ